MDEQRCPYPGLSYFNADYADLFFGRERELQRLSELLKHQTFVAVIGHQEVGKSSLVRAGLKRKPVQIQEKNDSEDWDYSVFRPGDRPLESLAFAIAAEVEAGHIEQSSFARRLEDELQSGITLNQVLTTFFPQHKLPKLIIIDQFEEIFFVAHRGDRDVFVKHIVDAVADHNETVRIVITLSSDALQYCFQYPQLERLLLELAHVFLDDLSGTSLHEVIVHPSRLAGLRFEEGLVQQIQEEAQDGGASISSVQMLLCELWYNRHGYLMTWEAYRHLGGVKNIITRMADRFFSELSDQEKQLCLNILSRLTTIQNGTVIKRCASHGECYPNGIEATTVDVIIMWLKKSQLVKENENGYLEITNQAVLHWEQLNEWLKENWAWLEFHQRLRESAKAWEDSSQDPLLLYRGTLLQELKSWAQQQPAMLNELERRFIDASLAQHGERRGKKGIFVNYRSFDTIQISHRLADSLCKIFGTTNIFIDENSIPPGVDFRDHIYRSIDRCAVLLVVIGNRWLEAKDDSGQIRLNNPNDFVRVEIELALRQGLAVVPILIDDAEIPTASELPNSIKQLSYLNALKLRSGRLFRNDLENLVARLRQIIGRRHRWNPFHWLTL